MERKDRIQDQTTTTGTGTITLAGVAPTGFRTFTGYITSLATVRYLIESEDSTEWEIGEGIFTDAGSDTLTRANVLSSSNAGALVNFSAGTKTVSVIVSAEDLDKIVAEKISDAAEKTTPVDADLIGLLDSAASFILKKLTWSNLKATLGAYFGTYSGAISDWKTLPTPTFVSIDGATNVLNYPLDLTGILSPGMRHLCSQDHALTAYWSMDTNSNSDVGSFNGTDTAMTYTAGKFGNAATFNGTTSKIVIADNAALKPTGEFTLGCWFKTGTTGTIKTIFQSYSQNTAVAGLQLRILTSNFLAVTIGKNTGTTVGIDYLTLTGTTTVTDNALHYVVVSFRNNYMQIYLDGRLEVSGYMPTPTYAATNYVRVGASNTAGGADVDFMNGQIDDLFLINGYALDEKTVKAKYDAQTAQGTGDITVQKYALITAVGAYSGGNTPITIWGGTDYSLSNSTISSPYYATVARPFGFDVNPAKWTVEVSNNVNQTQSTPTTSTWYNLGSLNIQVPIGKWNLGYLAMIYAAKSVLGQVNIAVTLSTANNSESDDNFHSEAATTCQVNAVLAEAAVPANKFRPIEATTKTTYYLNLRAGQANTSSIVLVGANQNTIIRATSTLL